MYEILMPFEIILLAGVYVFVLRKYIPEDALDFVGIISTALFGGFCWIKKVTIFDLAVRFPVWTHVIAIVLLSILLLIGKLFLAFISTIKPLNESNQ